jgi:hypothetical protein
MKPSIGNEISGSLLSRPSSGTSSSVNRPSAPSALQGANAAKDADGVTSMTTGTKRSLSTYSAWFDKSVVLLVAIRKCRVPLPCSIVGQSVADVRVRIKLAWEMDIRKELILAVEEYAAALDSRVN